MFSFLVMSLSTTPFHTGQEILVNIPLDATCEDESYEGEQNVNLQIAIDQRCLINDGDDFQREEGLCRFCKDSCGYPPGDGGDWIEVGGIWTYGGSDGSNDGDRYTTGSSAQYRYYGPGCTGNLQSLQTHTWGTNIKLCCAFS